MTALSIFLLVLKIIGIVLLSILGLLFLAFITVLFVPFRYYGEGGYSDQTGKGLFFVAGGSWLLRIFRVRYEFGLKEPLSLKILWIDLLKKKEKKSKKKKEIRPDFDDEDEDEDEESAPETVIIEDEPAFGSKRPVSDTDKAVEPEKAEEPEKKAESEKTDEPQNPIEPEKVIEPEKPVESEKAAGPGNNGESVQADDHGDAGDTKDFDRPPEKEKRKKTTQDKGKYDKIKRYVDILKSERFQRAFTLAKDSILKILKSLLPRKWKVEATLGFEDPSTLGTILGLNGMFYPVLHKHLVIHDIWDRQVIDVIGSFKGRITLGRLAFIAARVYFNKDVRKIIKLFKEA